MSEWMNKLSKTFSDWLASLFCYSVNVFQAFALNEIKMGVDKVPCECGTFNVTYIYLQNENEMHALKNQGTKYRHVAFTNSSDVSECANNAAAFAFGWANVYWPKLLLVLARQKRLSTSSSRVLGDKINGDRKIEITGARNPNVCYKDKTAPNRFHSEVSNV